MLNHRHIALVVTLASTAAFSSSCAVNDDDSGRRSDAPGGNSADGGGGVLGGDGGGDQPQGIPFEPVTPATYVPKVKNLLTGLPATDDEIAAVVKDPNALRGLIDGWMTLPSFQTRMLDFFRNAFQQNQVTTASLMGSLNVNNFTMADAYTPVFLRSVMDSFPQTAWELVKEGRPFAETLTTRRYMVTTAMLATMSYLDDQAYDDKKKFTNRLAVRNAVPTYSLDSASTVPVADSLDPTNANYMKFAFPGTQPTGCATTAATYTQAADGGYYGKLFGFLFGRYTFAPCTDPAAKTQQFASVFADADWNDWRMVTFNVDANAAGASPAFYEVAKLRSANAITVHTDRLGFFGTLAFDANWATNATNEARVTANQSLIVALGQSIAGENIIANFPVNATDASHATDPACQGCHLQLDPFKQFFRQSYSLYYSSQSDQAEINAQAGFAVGGANQTGKGVADLANIFASNARFPIAWVAKLHFWANSTAAIEDDPEIVRIANAFSGSNYDFKTLVRELFSSPLVTWASVTKTTSTNGVIVSISRRDQSCAALSQRLGLTDVCGMLSTKLTSAQSTIAARASLLPVDTYYRAYALPSLPTNPDMFFRQSTESICQLIADQVVDVSGGTGKYSSTAPDVAITDFVSNVMGLPSSDPRAAQATAILTDNFNASKATTGVNATMALKATFVLACISPTSVIVGL